MPRIEAEKVEELKVLVDLGGLVREHGVELRVQGDDLIGLCPFHDEETASFHVTPSKRLFHCFGCGAAGDVLTFVQKTEHVGFRRAVEILRARVGGSLTSNAPLITEEMTDQAALDAVVGYYASQLAEDADAKNYASQRLISDEALQYFRIGVANRTLGYRIPNNTTKEGRAIREQLERVGILKENGREVFLGCLTFPTLDELDQVVGLYGRRVQRSQRGAPNHLYKRGAHHGAFNLKGIRGQEAVILCESIIDALTFWCAGFRNVTCAYGVEGFSEQILDELKACKKVLIAFDADDAGNAGAERAAKRLMAVGVQCFRIRFPLGTDANEYALKNQPADATFRVLVNSAEWMGGGERVADVTPAASRRAFEEEGLVVAPTVVAAPIVEEKPQPPPTQPATPQAPPTAPVLRYEAKNDGDFTLQRGPRFYRAQGFLKNASSVTLRVTLSVTSGDNFHKNSFDLNQELPRVRFEKAAAQELSVEDSVIHRELGELLRALEGFLDERDATKSNRQGDEPPPMTDAERLQAEKFLKEPELLVRVLQDFERVGIVGEELNKLICYLAATSRKLRKPLAVMLKSSPAAGKSSLMDAVLSFLPEEDVKKYTAITEKSLYYMAEDKLRHKVLALAEEEGAEPAQYALKLLQSEGELNIASTTKDAVGNLSTRDYHIDGPVMVFQTTTREQTDQEFLSRCIELCADESEAQTGRIHDAQRRAFSLDAIVRQSEKPWIERVQRNAQRLLKPVQVRIPFVDELRFPTHRMQLRRDNPKYLALIESCAVLHQMQRKVHEVITEAGEVVQYIEATVADLEVANQLAVRIWGRSLDGLSARARQFLEELHAAVVEACGQLKLAQEEFWFSARWVRERMDLSPARVKVHLAALVEMELLRVHRPAKGVQGALYELDWHGEGLDGERFVAGLTDVEAVRRKFGGPSTTNALWLACGSGAARVRLASGSDAARHETPHVNAEKHHSNGNAGRKGLPGGVPVAG